MVRTLSDVGDAAFVEQFDFAHQGLLVVDQALNAEAGVLGDVFGDGDVGIGGGAGGVLRSVAKRRGDLLQQRFVDALSGAPASDAQLAVGDGAGFIEHHAGAGGEALDEGGAFEQNAFAAGAGDDRHGDGWRGNRQRAGAAGDQHSHGGADRIGDEERDRSNGEHGRQIERAVAFQQLHRRRFDAVGVVHQAGDAAEGAVFDFARHHHFQAALLVQRTGKHRFARADIARQRFTGDRRGIEGGGAAIDDAVGRHAVARADHDAVARHQISSLDRFSDTIHQRCAVVLVRLVSAAIASRVPSTLRSATTWPSTIASGTRAAAVRLPAAHAASSATATN